MRFAERAKKGLWNGGWAPLGYSHDPVTKQIHPDPVEAPIAKRVFELSKELRSAAKVAGALNAEGLRTPERTVKSRRGNEMLVGGKRFIPNKIKVIVTNPLYKGVVHHNGEDYPGEHEALVSEKLWEEANDALSGKEKSRKNAVLDRNTHQSLLKGIIRCGECGHRLTPKPGGKKDRDGNPYLYYTCNNVSKDGKAATCSLRNVPARAMDDFVIQILGEIGRRPEIIKAAVASSNEEKSKSMRPLKTKLAELQRKHTDMGEELQRYLAMVRKTDSAHFGRETLVAAEDLAKQKHELEREIEKVKIDIAYRERAVTDEHLVAKNLLDFEKTIAGVSFDEQCDLLRLLLRQVRVHRLDPKKEPIQGNPHTWSTQIRTQWFAVNLDLFASDLISRSCENPTASSHLDHDGGAGESNLRTSFGIPLIVGMPLPQHRLAPFVAEPFHFTWRSSGFGGDCQMGGEGRASSMRHPICRVLEWQERLNGDKGLTKVQIGEAEGLSKARITQMFSLLRLPEEVQQYLASLTSPALIKSFAIRRLMSVAKLPPARQIEVFEGMKAGAERRAG